MLFNQVVCSILCSLAALSVLSIPSAAEPADPAPETVLATFRVQPAQLPAFLRLMPEYWGALRAENLVLAEPHLVLRGEEDGRPMIVELFSWKNHDAPEHVPQRIQKYWDRINTMVESRDGHPGVEFPEMTIVK